MLVSLTLHTGHMGLACLDRNDGQHFRPALRRLIQPYAWADQIWIILDNGPSHASAETLQFFTDLSHTHAARRVRVLFTPSGASWLNLAEALLQAFSARYLVRGDWPSRPAMLDHLEAARHEYNHLFARPFIWDWSRRHFRLWLADPTRALRRIRCSTSATPH